MKIYTKLSIVIAALFFGCFSTASAAIFQQNDSSATQTNYSPAITSIGPGDNYNGQELTSITIKVHATSSIDNALAFSILGYRKSDGVNVQFQAANNGDGSHSVNWYRVSAGDNTIVGTFASGFFFSSANCYAIQIQTSFAGGVTERQIMGTISSPYSPPINTGCFSTSTGGAPNITNATGITGAYFVMATDGSTPPVNTNTRIDTVTPADGSTIATSTAATIGATGYVNANDYQSGMFLRVKYARFSSYQAATANPDNLFTTVEFPITTYGAFSFSTTTPIIGVGDYRLLTEIRQPSITNNIINFFGFGQFANIGISFASTTRFTAAHANSYDTFVASTSASIDDYIANSGYNWDVCNMTDFSTFSFQECFFLLFIPQTQPIMDTLTDFKNRFLTYAPWGYVTRIIVIATGNATSTDTMGISLRATITMPIGDPTTGTQHMVTSTGDPMEFIQGGSDLLSNVHTTFGDDVTFREAVEPWYKLVVAMMVMYAIFRHFMGHRHMEITNTGGKRLS